MSASENSTVTVVNDIDNAGKGVTELVAGAHRLMLEESVFVGEELFDRAQIETQLFLEFISKIAAAHSVKDIRTMYEECARHQIEFVRRDCDRLLKNSTHVIEAASELFAAVR